MANNDVLNDELDRVFRNHLEAQLKNGLAQGMYAACKLINDKAADPSRSAEDRLRDISEFCRPVLESREVSKEKT